MTDERLELRYIPLAQARRWDQNPKVHSIDALVRSIETHGYGDPAKFDATLDALVYGNGRTAALEKMKADGKEPPRGIGVTDDGDWAVPAIFGVDAKSRAAAVAFAIDHNNLTMMGGGLAVEDLLQIWDEEQLQHVLAQIPDAGALLASLGQDDIDALLQGPDFRPAAAEDQSRLDEREPLVCPECGAEIPR